MTPTDILTLIQKNSGLYEVITDYPHKVYFDIDKTLTDNMNCDDYRYKIMDKINELFPDPYAAISGSFVQGKASYHITLNNYLIRNDNERETIKLLVEQLNETFDDGFDWKVCTKNRNFKLIYQSKLDKREQIPLTYQDLDSVHFITCFCRDNPHPLPSFEITKPEIGLKIKIEKAKQPLNLGELPKLTLGKPDNFDINNTTPHRNIKLIAIK